MLPWAVGGGLASQVWPQFIADPLARTRNALVLSDAAMYPSLKRTNHAALVVIA
jgi:hypothetical protein